MKTLYTATVILFIAFSFSAKKIAFQETVHTLVATYIGATENQDYKFIDDNNVEYLFYDISKNISFEKEDDSKINKKFILTWKNKLVDEYDSVGQKTGGQIIVKTILSIKTK
ncbi:hypothetical protein [Polaribacter sp. Q13]|uniref:hypothetical protein n=1 Tax=Polaribacter sp. Q13 TaxID=2806551 RepID=UPI00193B6A4D|nr:hypothetical protein [Polaribacter sp. Q13]QVY64570.1 hypothetical protein JOP69_12425 [Polaribacter sp. Q13]